MSSKRKKARKQAELIQIIKDKLNEESVESIEIEIYNDEFVGDIKYIVTTKSTKEVLW